jgi:arginine-tRNA-protein transferase
MSIIPPGLSRQLQFFLSGPLPCPYLPDQVERKLFTRLTGEPPADAEINAMLTRAGFRRSHDIVYRPACPTCNACVPVRVPVREFAPSRSLKRIMSINRDLTVELANDGVTDEQYRLFMAYQAARHPDSDMARMTRAEFVNMLHEGEADTRIRQVRKRNSGELIGGIITDTVDDGLSAVYSFFAPGEARRSLGAQLILALIDEAQRSNLSYVYLGYWISASRKMSYKGRFRPLQALGPQGWEPVGDEPAAMESAAIPCAASRSAA